MIVLLTFMQKLVNLNVLYQFQRMYSCRQILDYFGMINLLTFMRMLF
jgi:hypothetical protein